MFGPTRSRAVLVMAALVCTGSLPLVGACGPDGSGAASSDRSASSDRTALSFEPERSAPDVGAPLRIFAAASLEDALVEVGETFSDLNGTGLEHNFAGSNTLALQIEAARAADVFVSADAAWVEHVIAAGAAEAGSAREVLSNRLVVVGRPEGIAPFSDFTALARFELAEVAHLALADPDAVPAGRYAKAALLSVDVATDDGDARTTLWDSLAAQIVPTADVRAALTLAEADPRTLAIVYASDATVSGAVEVLHAIDPALHPPIAYYAVAVLSAAGEVDPRAAMYLDHLVDPASAPVFVRFGFRPAEDTGAP